MKSNHPFMNARQLCILHFNKLRGSIPIYSDSECQANPILNLKERGSFHDEPNIQVQTQIISKDELSFISFKRILTLEYHSHLRCYNACNPKLYVLSAHAGSRVLEVEFEQLEGLELDLKYLHLYSLIFNDSFLPNPCRRCNLNQD